MITSDQLNEFLAQYGVSLPSVVTDAILAQLDSISACVDANYPVNVAPLIYLYAAAIMAGNTGVRQVKSQGAPSGASQSFDNPKAGFTQLRRTLAGIDTYGCTKQIIGADPANASYFRVVG
jgi:hypothetical protein